MQIAEALMSEFEHALDPTRRCLERVPEDKLGWRPHPESMSLGQLAFHIATTQAYVLDFAKRDCIDIREIGNPIPEPSSRQELLEAFEESTARVRSQLLTIDDHSMMKLWRVVDGDRELFTLPRGVFLRNIMLNHVYHHRGQLTVYLRLLNIPVPAIYGGSADEAPMFVQRAAE